MSAIIYLVTNTVNGKQYVGYTSVSLDARRAGHQKAAARGRSTAIASAIRKYGIDAFDWDVIFEHDDIQWTKDTMEPYFIDWYGTYEDGYNLTLGGEGTLGVTYGEDFRKVVSKQWRGVPKSKAHKEAIRQSLLGKSHSPDRVKKNRLSQPHAKRVSVDGKVFPSVSAVARELDCSARTVSRAIANNSRIKGKNLCYIP
jgi:group I intron endonuclease